MTTGPNRPTAKPPDFNNNVLYLRPRWRRAERILLVSLPPAGMLAFLGWFSSGHPAWFAPAMAVASAHAAVQVLGQRFEGPRRAMEVGLGASLMALLLSLSMWKNLYTAAALDPAMAFFACWCVWSLAAVVALVLNLRALRAEWIESQRAKERAEGAGPRGW